MGVRLKVNLLIYVRRAVLWIDIYGFLVYNILESTRYGAKIIRFALNMLVRGTLSKGLLFDSFLLFQLHPIFPKPPVKGCRTHAARLRGFSQFDFAFLPSSYHITEIVRDTDHGTPEFYTIRFGGGDPLRLTFAYVFTLVLCDKGKNLQYNVGKKSSHQVFSVSRVKQRHINHGNVDFLFAGEESPLFLYFIVISPKTVDAENIQKIAFFHFLDKLFVPWSVEVLAGLFINIDVPFRDFQPPHFYHLPFFILIQR